MFNVWIYDILIRSTSGYVSTQIMINYGEDGPYISKVYGSNSAGFIPIECNGSSTTYYHGGYRYKNNGVNNTIVASGSFDDRNGNKEYSGIFSIIETGKNDNRGSMYGCVRIVFLQ